MNRVIVLGTIFGHWHWKHEIAQNALKANAQAATIDNTPEKQSPSNTQFMKKKKHKIQALI